MFSDKKNSIFPSFFIDLIPCIVVLNSSSIFFTSTIDLESWKKNWDFWMIEFS